MLTFASPLWLLALPLPYFLWLVVARRREIAGVISSGTIQAQPAIVHSQADVLAGLAADDTGKGRKQRVPWLWLFGCMLLLTAMGRPQWLDFSSPAAHQGHNIMLAIDVSGSMRALDFVVDGTPTSRLDVLKQVTRQFLDHRTHDRIGLIMFADDALTFMPMTTDIAMVRNLLDEIRQGVAGEKTALGDTIALAVQRLRDASSISTKRLNRLGFKERALKISIVTI